MAKTPESLSAAVIKKIDALCARFEADWKAGKEPDIEKYLGASSGAERAELLRVLLKVDIAERTRDGQTMVNASFYLSRFQEDTRVVQSLFRELGGRTAAQKPGSSIDTTVGQESMRSGKGKAKVPAADDPHSIGRFKVLAVLGQGAFGKVFKCHDPQLDREVAVKVPLRGTLETQDEIDRFLREARAAATLHHPNICAVHEVGQDNGNYYLVMPYVQGKTLAALLKERKEPMSTRQAALVIRKLAQALHIAHGKGIIHRDLKPANILIERERGDVVIMDFGLARRRKPGDSHETQEGSIMGTPAYMAPEQACGDVKSIGPASDVYSLGIMLYEMLAGRPPFTGSAMEVLGKVLHVEAEPPSTHRSGLDAHLEQICLKAIAKDLDDRYPSMKALADALSGFLEGAEKEAPASRSKTKGKSAESARFSDVIDAMATERQKETREAIEEAVRRARIPMWQWLAGAGVVAVVLLVGIFLITRGAPTATVMIVLDVDVKDKSYTFLLDGKPIPGAKLEKPLELPLGSHVLEVKRDGESIRRYVFHLEQDSQPRIELRQEIMPEATEPPDPGWVSLFNGKDLSGWEGLPGFWSWSDGALVGSSKGIGFNTFLCSKRAFKDFEVKFQVKLQGDKANSGLQIRSMVEDRGKFMVKGPQGDMGEFYWGSLYGERFGGMMQQAPKDLVAKVLKKDDFNDYYIKCVGKHVTIMLNGVTTVDGDFPTLPEEGILAWQIHSGAPMDVAFRDILLRDLSPADGWTSLFNGKDLTGWVRTDGAPAKWKVENGYMEMGPGLGSIMTQAKSPLDFELHAEFWLPRLPDKTGQGRANSGIYLLGRHEIQILDMVDNPSVKPIHGCGALYGLVAPRPGGIRPPETWQTFDITYHAPRFSDAGKIIPGSVSVVHNGVSVIDNGSFTAENTGLALDKEVGTPGPIMLQNHGGAPVRFRNLKIRSLPTMNSEAGLVPLFNGKDLTGWEKVGAGEWKAENGILAPQFMPKPSWLATQRDYGDFELELEYRLGVKGNSGVFVHAWKEGDLSGGQFLEVQLIHDEAYNTVGQKNGTAAIFAVVATKPAVKSIPNTWHRLGIRSKGRRLQVSFEGQQVMDANLDDYSAAFKRFPGLQKTTGRIGLQQYGSPVEFRNIRLRELSALPN